MDFLRSFIQVMHKATNIYDTTSGKVTTSSRASLLIYPVVVS